MQHTTGFILGALVCLIYVNDMFQTVYCDLFLYTDVSCLVSQYKDPQQIEQILNKNILNVCNSFVDNRLSIQSIQSILLAKKEVSQNIRYGEITYSNYIYYFRTTRRSLVKINDYCH